jgi:hypothetical protein
MLTVAYADCRKLALYAECRKLALYGECHYAECRYAECHYTECRYAECHYAECRYAECCGAIFNTETNYVEQFPTHSIPHGNNEPHDQGPKLHPF